MSKIHTKQTPEKRLELCQSHIQSIASRLIEAIHLNEMCEIVIFSNQLSDQIPFSYAGNSFSSWQTGLIKQYALLLCTLWDRPMGSRNDQMSFPVIVSYIDSEVISLAKKRSYDYWYEGCQVNFGHGYEHFTDRQLDEETVQIKQDTALNASEYVEPCIRKVLLRMDSLVDCKLVRSIRDLRDLHLAHHLDPKLVRNAHMRNPKIKWDAPRKLLHLSLWCCHNLSLGLTGNNQNFKDSFKIAKLYNEELWHNCKFDIPKN